jgi:hypothetical protein
VKLSVDVENEEKIVVVVSLAACVYRGLVALERHHVLALPLCKQRQARLSKNDSDKNEANC